jgi:thymidylate synthase ThyX
MTISATIIADSISPAGQRITTFELSYPRFFHSEFLTHRLFSRNAASSRAIPIDTVLEQVSTNPAMPEEWGINQSGMQAKSMLEGVKKTAAQFAWKAAAKGAVASTKLLQAMGLHKQIVNRILEPFVHIKVVVTATEYNNWYHLRNHTDAQPEIRILAERMLGKVEASIPQKLEAGEWHLPYIRTETPFGDIARYWCGEESLLEEDAIKISASLCAQVSYRKSDESLDKALKIYNQLVTMTPVHASPFEHQATPMPYLKGECCLDDAHEVKGVTHMDMSGNFWSGNFKGWIQNRQLIKDNVVEG